MENWASAETVPELQAIFNNASAIPPIPQDPK
jgi:hypothetical protein